MPIIRVELFTGRTQQQKNYFVAEVTKMAAETLKCPVDAVDVIFSEVEPLDWHRGGQPFTINRE